MRQHWGALPGVRPIARYGHWIGAVLAAYQSVTTILPICWLEAMYSWAA